MDFAPNIPISWLDEFKKSLRRGNQATPDDIQPLDDLASRRLSLPDATPNRIESGPRAATPLDDTALRTASQPSPPSTDLASLRLAQSPAPTAELGLSPTGTPNAAERTDSAPYPFTPRPTYTPAHQPGEAIGLGQRILHALKGVGLGAVRGAGAGGAGMLGGAITGGVAAGVDPNAYHKLKYNTLTLPEWRQTYEDEAAQAKTQQGLEESQSRIANTQTDNDLAERRLAATEAAQKTNEGYRRDTLTETQSQHRTTNAQQAKAEHDQRHPGEPYPPNVTDAMPWLKGEKAPTANQRPAAPHWAQDTNGTWVDLNAAKGPVQGKVSRDPNDITPAEVFRENKADEREARASRREQRQQLDRAEGNLRRAQQAINNARMTSANKDASQDQIDKAWQSAGDIVDEMVSNHPDVLEGGKGTGGYPYIQWKGGQKPAVEAEAARPARSARGRSAPGHKIGDTVVVNGKSVKIGKIYPDGSFDPE